MPEESAEAILLVEDQALIAMAEKAQLEAQGYAVIAATSGEQAIELCDTGQFDLILMDIDLGPGRIDGPEAARRILETQNTPIVFLTSHSEQEMVDRVEGTSGYGYVLKNSGEFILKQSIRMALKLHRAHRRTVNRESRYYSLFNSFRHPITIYDAAATIIDVNEAGIGNLRLERSDVIGHPLRSIIPDMHEATERRISETLEGDETPPYRDEITLPDGSHRVYESYFSPIAPESGGQSSLVQVVSYDVTDKRQAEQRVREQLIDLQLAHRIAGIGYWQFDPEIGVPIWSDEIYRIYERDPASGPPDVASYCQIYAPDQYETFLAAFLRAVKEGKPYDITLRLDLPDGRTKWVHALGEPQPPAGPAGYFIRGTIQDITGLSKVQS